MSGSLHDELLRHSCRVCGWPFAGSDDDDEWLVTLDAQDRVAAITCDVCMTTAQHLEGSAITALAGIDLDHDPRPQEAVSGPQ